MCTHASHAEDKASHAPTLRYHAPQLDEDGSVAFHYWHCTKCDSTLGMKPAGDDLALGALAVRSEAA